MRSDPAAGHQARQPVRRPGVLALSCAAILLTVPGLGQTPASRHAARDPRADQLLVVDCLLPGQIRHLGQRTVYMSPRRPARLPARDCEIRGGEYVAYDRADLKTALAAWLPLAEQGNLEAQVIVGEMYERGLGLPADHAAALAWYQRAADAGSRRAQVNLGFLYERGLGVPADAAIALDWYRRAAGREAAILLDPSIAAPPAVPAPSLPAAADAANEDLQARARILEAALEQLRADLAASRRDLDEARGQLADSRSRAAESRSELESLQARPDRSAEVIALQQELQRRDREAAALEGELATARVENDQRLQELARRSSESTIARAALDEERNRLAVLVTRLTDSERQLAAQRARIAELERPVAAGRLAGPEIALVMPQLKRTRDIVPVAKAAGPEVQVVGRVTAPAGVVAVTINDRAVTPNELGVFSLSLPLPAAEAPVMIVAVDRQGKRGELRFMLRGDVVPVAAANRAQPVRTRSIAAGVEFGTYHALIIGNNDYRYLPDLGSPVVDATELARLLERRYGFRTTVLLNADRYQVLSALNVLREKLTAKDNLLLYYAGHGELDEVNQRGHWLPVDAERDSTANWIPSTAVTDILNIMQAKQILLVVDSCYAGVLTRSSFARLRTGMTAEEQLHWFRTMASKRSRTVLTSGGKAPVLDAGGGGHSVFARALLEVLEANQEALDGQRLYREVAARVAYAAASLRFDQVPEYAPIRHAGHEAGEFFLIPGS
ncbi:MAG: caspase family protein [Gammaproteobacteria bacterium]|nr:caspase family protein [Gammaproteobacteria bacterium]